MTPQEQKQLIRRLYEESATGNFDILDEVYTANCTLHDPAFPVGSLAEMKEMGRQMRNAVPDLHMNIHEILADGDTTAVRWTMGGTQRGEFQGLPPTGRTFVMTGVTVDKWEGDRIVEEWNSYDVAGLYEQLGFMPAKEQLLEMAAQRANR